MKKILITGSDSYIGTSVETYLNSWENKYTIETIDMIDGTWREKDFFGYDVVFHVAGIAHSDTTKISSEQEEKYYSVNTNLAIEVAQKAKTSGVSQFIFMSSAIVYGESAPIGKKKIITKATTPSPSNCYGDSKLKAENGICKLRDSRFKVVILRPPMIYGKGSKGNYTMLSKYAKKLPFFPFVNNERSMIYIENFCEFIRFMIDNEEDGLFWPQNKEYTNTSLMVKSIAVANSKKIRLVRGFVWILKLLSKCTQIVNKAFGNLCYEHSLSEYKENYQIVSLEESIDRTEK